MRDIDRIERRVAYFLRKCDEAAASNEPWAVGNLRTYQDYYSKALKELYIAEQRAGETVAP